MAEVAKALGPQGETRLIAREGVEPLAAAVVAEQEQIAGSRPAATALGAIELHGHSLT
jgi:hypothetical protein